jgi:hypothetical protein
VLFLAHRYLIGDSLFAALDFEGCVLAHGKGIESQGELTDQFQEGRQFIASLPGGSLGQTTTLGGATGGIRYLRRMH